MAIALVIIWIVSPCKHFLMLLLSALKWLLLRGSIKVDLVDLVDLLDLVDFFK